MNEIEAVERMPLVLDSAIHMHTALFAGMALNGRFGIHDSQLVFICRDADVVARNNCNLREQRAVWFPAPGTTANMVMRTLSLDLYLDFFLRTATQQRPA